MEQTESLLGDGMELDDALNELAERTLRLEHELALVIKLKDRQ